MRLFRQVVFAGLALAGMLTGVAFAQNSTAAKQNTVVSGQSSVSSEPNPQEQPLGTYARSVRKEKNPATKTFDNDNLPKRDTISVIGDSAEAAASPASISDTDAPPQTASGTQDTPKVTPGQSQEERQKVYDKWQEKLSNQQGQIDSMAHELDLDQREYRMRAATFYSDAGERLRNQGQWDKDDAEYKQKIAEKQKALDDAKAKLNDMQEDARKAGVPESAQHDTDTEAGPR